MSAGNNGERTIALVLYPGLAALDFIGPLQVLKTLEQFEPRYKTVVVAARKAPAASDVPILMIPDATFEEVPHPYAIVVPGGRMPTVRAMSDPVMRAYVHTAADSAEIVASVCTGSLILASLGLLDASQHDDQLVLVRSPRPIRRELRARALGRGWQVHHVGGRICRHRHGPLPRGEADRRGDRPQSTTGARSRSPAAVRRH